jgi:uncharacterized membrane protein YbaN (DUF454 family)
MYKNLAFFLLFYKKFWCSKISKNHFILAFYQTLSKAVEGWNELASMKTTDKISAILISQSVDMLISYP